ncbi:hypothetical protein RMSM_06507 [Rhodopirellula maiorica SM1]|uniref:Uncharacterized protein n=1 Tax=Rhodopirellula maiorica SM1 TaxID=1265738 RepID=M5RRH2_9BACT|nr:hypothetical protein RMSM_06507 [Rhodopirellula maiorica SM1]
MALGLSRRNQRIETLCPPGQARSGALLDRASISVAAICFLRRDKLDGRACV